MTNPADPWSLVESAFDVRYQRHYEALFALGSGPLQQRAALEEGLRDDPQDLEYLHVPGSAANATPRGKSRVGTFMPGVTGPHPTCGDELINLPALHGLAIYAAGERLDMEHGRLADYERRLDLQTGRLIRRCTWHTRAGTTLGLRFERFISACRRHALALRATVEHLRGPAVELRFVGSLDAEVRTNGFDHFRAIDITGEHEPITLTVRTNSGIDVAAAAILTCDRGLAWTVETQPRWVGLSGSCMLDPGCTIHVSKFATLTSSRHVSGSPLDAARRLVWDAAGTGFHRLAQESDAVWKERWDATDVVIEGDPQSQLALRTGLYHVLRAVIDDDPRGGIDATAASGELSCGRVSWETDLLVLPLLLYTRPSVGQTLARFRIEALEGARRKAGRLGYPGACYPWSSAASGEEECRDALRADPAVHVTADVAYALWHAHRACANDAALLGGVTEVLSETARYWAARVSPTAEGFALLGVTGPDEYTPLCHNNAYTNRMAALALHLTTVAWEELARVAPRAATALREKLQLDERELARFRHIAGKLRMPIDAGRQLVLPCDGFFELEPFDLEQCWPDRTQPLAAGVSLERLHRSRVLQQADVIQLMALLPHEFTAQQMHAAYETYAPLTAHDAPHSRAVYALVAARLGQTDESLRLWREAVGIDQREGAAADGVHVVCAGACWQAVIFGFAGVQTLVQSNILQIDPHLPPDWTALRFPLVWEGQRLQIHVDRQGVTVDHRGERPVAARISGHVCTLEPGQTASFAG